MGGTQKYETDEKAEAWRLLSLLHTEKLDNLYSSQNIVKYHRLGKNNASGNVARVGEMMKKLKCITEQFEGKRPSRRIILKRIVKMCELDSAD
jgi:hypothetical protein